MVGTVPPLERGGRQSTSAGMADARGRRGRNLFLLLLLLLSFMILTWHVPTALPNYTQHRELLGRERGQKKWRARFRKRREEEKRSHKEFESRARDFGGERILYCISSLPFFHQSELWAFGLRSSKLSRFSGWRQKKEF